MINRCIEWWQNIKVTYRKNIVYLYKVWKISLKKDEKFFYELLLENITMTRTSEAVGDD